MKLLPPKKKNRKIRKVQDSLTAFSKNQQTGHLQEITESPVSDLGPLNEFEWEVFGCQVKQIVFFHPISSGKEGQKKSHSERKYLDDHPSR